MQQVLRLVVASLAVSDQGIFQQMQDIRASALKRNRSLAVHAALIYQSGWFIYWAEGPPETLAPLVEKIRADARNHSARLLHQSAGPRELPTHWSMMVSSNPESAGHLGARVAALRTFFDQKKQLNPRSIIRRLIAPLRVGEPGTSSQNESFHRVGVCSAASHASFDLVRWLAERHDAPFEVRRFFGEDDIDSASKYVEFMNNGWPCRVIAVARQSLLHGLRRVFFADWSHLVLLLSGTDSHDMALLNRVRVACGGLAHSPCLIGFAPSERAHVQAATAAAATGLNYVASPNCLPGDFEGVWSFVSKQLQSLGAPQATSWSDPFALDDALRNAA